MGVIQTGCRPRSVILTWNKRRASWSVVWTVVLQTPASAATLVNREIANSMVLDLTGDNCQYRALALSIVLSKIGRQMGGTA